MKKWLTVVLAVVVVAAPVVIPGPVGAILAATAGAVLGVPVVPVRDPHLEGAPQPLVRRPCGS